MFTQVVLFASLAAGVVAAPAKIGVFDIHAHRGGRGNTVESTLPSFAWGLINGANTLELDNGITADGVVVVWHDEQITADKCTDTKPVKSGDPAFPYVGKFVANLTWAQLSTIDCGSKRLTNFPFQLTYPKTRISTMTEVFDFASCVDPAHRVKWNIESKINPVQFNQTKGVKDFVTLQHAAFKKSPYYKSITYQSFDWRTLIAMKKLAPEVLTSALIDDTTYFATNGTPSAWLGGVNIDKFGSKKDSIDLKIPRAAASIGAGVLSPYVGNGGGTTELVPFVTKAMVKESHRLGLFVKPWTVNNLTVLADHVSWGIDGTITDYPDTARRWALHQGLKVARAFDEDSVTTCLDLALAAQRK